jgi:hypothetical protein
MANLDPWAVVMQLLAMLGQAQTAIPAIEHHESGWFLPAAIVGIVCLACGYVAGQCCKESN